MQVQLNDGTWFECAYWEYDILTRDGYIGHNTIFKPDDAIISRPLCESLLNTESIALPVFRNMR